MLSWGWLQGCGEIVSGQGPLLLALFLAGLGGGVTHCLTMCSIFVLGQAASVADKGVVARLLLPYHAGRVTTYAGLGVLGGLSFGLIAGWSGFTVLRHFILAAVAMIFLMALAGRLLNRAGLRLPFRLSLSGRCDFPGLRRLMAAGGALPRFGLGLSLGFLPCPMVFAAIMAASASASPLIGGLAMLAFGLGTMPALMGLSFASLNLLQKSPRLLDGLTLAALGINGVILLTLAVG